MAPYLFLKVPSSVDPGDVPEAPAPVAALQPGEWYVAPNTDARQVEHTAGELAAGGWSFTRFAGIVDRWSSGCLDTKRYRLIIHGGGRGDYGINCVLAFDLSALSWSRIFNGTPENGVGLNPVTPWWPGPPAGPVPCHTNNMLQYSDRNGIDCMMRMARLGGSNQSGSDAEGSRFNMADNTWTDISATSPWPELATGPTAIHQDTGIIWFVSVNNGRLTSYDPSTDTLDVPGGTSSPAGNPTAGAGTGAIDPVNNILVITTPIADRAPWMFDLNNPDRGVVQLSTSGPTDLEAGKSHGFEFSRAAGVFVGHKFVQGTQESDVYTLSVNKAAGTAVWTRVTATSGAPDAPAGPSHPAYQTEAGRWRYVPNWDRFVLMNGVDNNVAFYRL